MEKKKVLLLILCIATCEVVGGVLGSIFTIPAIPGWYLHLNKPSFTPPSWLFGPVWTTLYLLMGISLFLVYTTRRKAAARNRAIILFAAQLLLNLLWSVVFFGFHSPFYGFVIIVLLWLAILATIIQSYFVRKSAAYVLIPYIIWVTVASLLNFYVLILN